MEAYETARVFNDLMMPINETGLIQGAKKLAYTEISNWIYSYSEGRDRSKHSVSQYTSKQTAARWHGISFATSEPSIDQFAKAANAERADGEYARCTDVPAFAEGYETIFDHFDDVSGTRATLQWAREELDRFREACAENCGVAGSAFIRRLPKDWNQHPAFIRLRVKEFVDAVNGSQLTDVKHHAAKNFGLIYAGACLAIKKKVLPWNPKDLLESIRICFLDAMGCVTTPRDILVAGQAMLREALQESGKWPSASKWSEGDIGFVGKLGSGRMRYVAEMHAFRDLFDDPNQDGRQARMVLGWLHDKGLMKVSPGKSESLEAAIWRGKTIKWPVGEPRRGYEFFHPF